MICVKDYVVVFLLIQVATFAAKLHPYCKVLLV